jgi:hypothetical protein
MRACWPIIDKGLCSTLRTELPVIYNDPRAGKAGKMLTGWIS